MRLLIFLLCLITFDGYAQSDEIEQLISIQNIHVSEMHNICFPDICLPSHLKIESLSYQLSIANETTTKFQEKKIMASNKSLKFEAYSVAINTLNGFIFHVADYYDGTRVVTALDGNLRGYQVIAVNGVMVASSTGVEWNSDNFVHYYQNGKVISHFNRQTLELY